MATLAFSLAGQFVGGLFGGPLGATLGRAIGALAGSAVDGMVFGEERPPIANDLRLQGSSEGGAVPRLYGWNRVSGNIIWARELELLTAEGGGAKGMSGGEGEDEIGASFAVAFCEGEVQTLGRIWADGQILETEGLTIRFYRGDESQLSDSLIEATQGAGKAPAYRGLCYVVFEQLPISQFGNRIPQFSVELCRVVGELEPQIRAVTLIPGSTEYGYDPNPLVRLLGAGAVRGENTHVSAHRSDWSLSVDQLQQLCPNLERVALVVAWFGDDLRCGSCQILPRVESASRSIDGVSWSVAGLGRGDVPVISTHDGGPAYGGTPADTAVLAAIADLKARGIAVTLYPMVLMDVQADNGLTDPYSGGTGQAAYPWRGRITCAPAPGRAGTPDQTSAINAQVADFATKYRSMILHYAHLAASAGGVDALFIGSELVGLTSLRGAENAFPFVDALVTLAADVRAIVGSSTKLTYAADWSEYSGYQSAGEKFFHLDPLWASPDIDAVGIDNYMPLSDWRDGDQHADAALAASGYDLDYLSANIAGGEGYDWYYASDAARTAGVRTAISDGTYAEPWIWRPKDIANWWSHAHYNRPLGVRAASPTAWVAANKPIWFTELGCGAVDKASNQPNVFSDPKSADSGRPHFSSGHADLLIQRQFLRAHQLFWSKTANNPSGMVDLDRVYLWTWDARPFPAFPHQTNTWSDGPNHATGHWLTGRLGGLASDELTRAIARDYDVTLAEAMASAPLILGYQLAQASTCREALSPVLKTTGLTVRDSAAGLLLEAEGHQSVVQIRRSELAETDKPLLAQRRPDPGEAIGRMALSFVDRERDYLTSTVTAMRQTEGALTAETCGLVLDASGARMAAERLLGERGMSIQSIDLALPPSQGAIEPGDLIEIDGVVDGPFVVTEIRDGVVRSIGATSTPNPQAVTVSPMVRGSTATSNFAQARPVVVAAQLPPTPEDPLRSRLAVAAFAQPWPGEVSLVDDATGRELVRLPRRGSVGTVTTAFPTGPIGVWDHANTLTVELLSGHLASLDPLTVLAGGNRLAVANDAGEWEIIGFADAALIAPQTYRLSRLLRGQEGSGAAMGAVSGGNQIIVLDRGTTILSADTQHLGGVQQVRVYAGSADLSGTALSIVTGTGPVLPLAPVGLTARRVGGSADISFAWTRRSRADGNGWVAGDAPQDHLPERYQITIFNGGTAVRIFESSDAAAGYSTAQQSADFGTPPSSFGYRVQQIGPVFGPGHPATGAFNG